MKLNSEVDVIKYLKKNWDSVFPNFRNVQFETSVVGWHSDKTIGHVDITFSYRGSRYACEAKFTSASAVGDLWDSTKVLAYCAALKIKTGQSYKPCVLLPKKTITTDTLPILGKLNLNYIVFTRDDNGIMFEYLL